MRIRLASGMVDRLRSTYWFVPSILTVAAVVAAAVLTAVDRRHPDATSWLGWAYGGGAEGARALLSAVAGSIVTVVSVTFSVMVVALTVSSQHFGPRLLKSFMRDQPAQVVLGVFTGTFAYCLMVLRTVQGDGGDRYSFFVPHLAVTGALILTLVSVSLLIYYVHHVALSMQVSEITARVSSELDSAIERLYPDPIGNAEEAPDSVPAPPEGAVTASAVEDGYLQEIDADLVLELATEHETTIWLTARPGDFVVAGQPVAAAWPPPADPERLATHLAQAYVYGADRTSFQDAAFGVQQLVEVALRALSPGVNEPFTAITCIDRLRQALTQLAARTIPAAVRSGEDGRHRVVARPRTFVELLDDAYGPIARDGARDPAVAEHLLESLGWLAGAARRPGDRAAIARLADRIWANVRRELGTDADEGRSASLHRRVHQVIAAAAPDESERLAPPARPARLRR